MHTVWLSHVWKRRKRTLLGLKRLHGFLEVTAAQVKNRSRIGINKWYQSFALRNFDLEDMELESTNSGPTAKLPILKLGEYEMWAIRIKQYFQIQDYALWEVIENGDSWVPISQTTKENGITTLKMSTPTTAEEKIKKKNDVKARDAKSMFAAIETRFGGNAATKKTQKTLLKQQYKNFSTTSAESLDSIFNRLQKIVSRLAILGVIIAQEDLNLKFLSSLPPEWNTHVVVWMNKPEIETMSIDDLYNNFKIVEQKIKKTVGTSSGGQNLAFMTAPSSSSTNDANTAYSQVSAASPSVNTASPQVCTASVSDNTVYAFMVENPNGSNVLHQDLEQIHEDDLEAMDLKWQLSLLSVRAKKYYQKTGKKIFINGNDIAGYDKSKVECYNCHKLGHFSRECRASRSKEDQFRNQDNTRKQGNKEDTSKVMLVINGVGFDWSDMAEEQVQTNMALMAFSDSEPDFKGYGPENSKKESNVVCENETNNSKENSDKSLRNCTYHQKKNVVSGNNYNGVDNYYYAKTTHHRTYKNVNPRAVLLRTGLKPLSTAKTPVNIVRPRVINTARQNRTSVNAARANRFNAGKPQHNDKGFVDSGCSRYMTGNIAYLSDFKQFNGGYVAFGRGAYGGKISGKGTLMTANLDFKDVYFVNELKFNLFSVSQIEKGIKKEYSVARTPQQIGVSERRNRTPIEAARTMLADSKLPTTFWADVVFTACYVQNKVLVVKPHNKTPYELFRGFKPALSFMRPFGCHVTILNTLDSLGKFDGKSDEGFFVGYSLSSKAFRVYNTRTKRVEENLHIGFLENKPMIEGNGPKWLFDIDSLTQSMNYVPVTTGTVSNDSAGTSEENSQDCIVMPIWKDTSYFDSPTKDVDNGEPKTADDAQKQVEDGPNNENDEQERFADDSSTKDVNAAGTASPNEEDSTEEEPEVDLGNITNSYIVPTTPNTRIHKDHPIDNVIGEVQSTVQTRRMSKPTSEQGFLSDVYEQKTHDTLNTCLYACFLSQIEPTSIAKALSDSSWVEAMQEELLQFKLQQVWILVDLPNGKKAIGTKWVFRNKKDERGIVIRNKARGKIDQTLFIKKQKGDILLVQVYVDDIIFGLTNKELWLQVQQKEDGIFISQDKYVAKILKKFNYSNVKSTSTLVDLEKPLVKDGDANDVDVHLYISMIGSLMYLTASRPDIMFAVCACARFQVTPKTSHLLAVKRIFRCLKGKLTLSLWYSRDSPFELQTVVATSTTEAEYVAAASCCGQIFLQKVLMQADFNTWSQVENYYCQANVNAVKRTWALKLQLFSISYHLRHCLRGGISQEVGTQRYLSLVVLLTKVGNEAIHKELGDRMERAATTASSLEAEQDSGSGPRCQDTLLGDGNAQSRFEITSIQFIDPPLSRGYTLGSGEDINDVRLKLVLSVLVSAVKRMLMLPVQVSVVEESSIRSHLDDIEGIDCLPTATIFEELARMGYEKPSQKLTFYKAIFSPQCKYYIHTITHCLSAKSIAWNEFSSSMASLIICLATNQKFNMSKYIFDAMVKHLDGGVKFLLYPQSFANMKRAGKDFSGRITPLFDTMMVQLVEEMGEDSDHPTHATPIPIIDQPSLSSQSKKDKPSKKAQRQEAEVLDLQKAKDAQANEIVALMKRIQSIKDIDADVDVSLVDETQERQDDVLMFDIRVLEDDVMHVEAKVDGKDDQSKNLDDSTAGIDVTTAGIGDSTVPTTSEEITLAQTLIRIKVAKPKVVNTAATTTTTIRPTDKGVVVQEPSEFRVPQEIKPSSSKDKRKGIMIEPEVPLKRKDQIALYEQIARDIQAKLDVELLEEQKLARK
ncbi:putative ribonuclease H-like domain-containing protein [Tanacetum coccineum]|uniref:Ribonuclease H-like domain-containing protein n=1 Tax=Tanacetum coccineum TaxID=301880 RepID=A0ABQ5IFI5_9ASTR